MKKILLTTTILGMSAAVFAESTYIGENYTVALDNSTFKSGVLNTTTLTPIVYKKQVLPAGQPVTINCKDGTSTLMQLANYDIKEKITLGNSSKIGMTCAESASPGLFWSNDEIKVKSDAIQDINKDSFVTIPFSATNSADGKVTKLTSNGVLTNLTVNKQKYFDGAKFYAVINGNQYYIQATNDDNVYSLAVSNFSKLIITDANGEILATVTSSSN